MNLGEAKAALPTEYVVAGQHQYSTSQLSVTWTHAAQSIAVWEYTGHSTQSPIFFMNYSLSQEISPTQCFLCK